MASLIIKSLSQYSPVQRHKILSKYIQELLMNFLELDSKDLMSGEQSFIDLGTDSAQAIEFKLKLEEELNCSLKTTVLFDYPNLNLLVDFLLEEIVEIDTNPTINLHKNADKEKLEDEIAIVGMACRMPGGVMNPKDFWELLINNENAIEEVPKSRWDIDQFYADKKEPGKVSNKYGGFIKHIKEFDPQFFGISSKEASEMDPQQRILMEVAWEAIENSGQSANDIKGKDIGVFIGIRNTEYYPPEGHRDPKEINFYSAIGTQLSAASGRLSYFLGLTGPSLSIDTACSSSMTALHYACESIRNNESEGALVGGVNILVSGEMNVAASQGNMLSSDGFCKTFSSKADGYVRSEGSAVFYLKPLNNAQQDGDPILAVICATGINQDGASGGLTVPYAPAQESLIRKTLDKANLKPEDIDYIEAHGTGTPLGDPIEVQSLNNTIGIGHKNTTPLKIGSVKTNIGHTEPVAGLAGLMKTVLSLQHQMLPANLHADPPNPYIDWDSMPIEIVRKNTPWYKNKETRYAGISSFGFTGTNTHAIIKESPLIEITDTIVSEDENYFFVCSAKTEKALKTLAQDYVGFFENVDTQNLQNVCYTSVIGRNHFQHRLSLIANSKEDILKKLKNSLEKGGETYTSKISLQQPKLAFVMPDSLDYTIETAVFLCKKHPVFKKIIEECDVHTNNNYQFIEFFSKESDQNDILDTWDNLVLCFTSLYAYTKCWKHWGVIPDFLIGNNQDISQILMACIAGVLDYIGGLQLLELSYRYKNDSIGNEKLVSSIDQIKFDNPNIDIVTDTLNCIDADQIRSTLYWKDQIMGLNSVTPTNKNIKTSFAECELFLCIGRYQDSNDALKKTLEKDKRELLNGAFNQKDHQIQLLKNIQKIYHSGISFNWINYTEGQLQKKVVLPNYPFQRKHYWLENTEKTMDTRRIDKQFFYKNAHPLLGNKILLALTEEQTTRYTGVFNARYPDFLKDHKVYDDIIVPGAAYIEMAIAGGVLLEKENKLKNITLSDISLREVLTLKEEDVHTQTSFLPLSDHKNQYKFNIHSLIEGTDKENPNNQWKTHVNGTLKLESTTQKIDALDSIDKIKKRCVHIIEGKVHYEEMSNAGLHYGTSFQGIQKIWYNKKEALAQICLPDQLKSEITRYRFHPVLLDSCFQGLSAMLSLEEKQEALMPMGIQSITFYDTPDMELWCYMGSLERIGDKYYIADFHIVNDKGENIVFIKGLKLTRIKNTKTKTEKENKEIEKSEVRPNDNLYSVSWIAQPEHTTFISDKERMVKDPISWLVLSDSKHIGNEFVTLLEKKQERVIEIFQDDIDFTDIQDWKDFLEEEFDESFPLLKGIVNLWGIEQSFEQEGLHSSILCIQAIEQLSKEMDKDINDQPRLWWITKGGQSVANDIKMLNPKQSTLWGFRTSLASEMTNYKPSCIDLDPSENSAQTAAQHLMDEIWNPGIEDQVAFRKGDRYVARLSNYELKKENQTPSLPSKLQINEYGILENLKWVTHQKRIPQDDEVQIAVAASALNFKDVLHTLGVLQEYSRQQGITDAKDQPLGFECSGSVIAVGNNVRDVNVGDHVIATSLDGCMKNFITVSSAYVIPKPSNLSMQEAASVPTVFMTSVYGLEELAKIKKGDKILIHACAGGVGQAALQIAQNAGATIFATASKSKWDFLKSKGVEHIMDSRSLKYADQINEITNGKGVDIILNSLKGEYIPKNLEVLAKNGSYIEIGKIDIWNKDQIKETRPDINYFVFDLGDDIRDDHTLYKKLLLNIAKRFSNNELQPIPITEFDISEANEAFAYLAQAKNIGKVVLSVPEVSTSISETKNYVITGGLGSLGLKVAERLAILGAKHISLIGRTLPKDQTKENIETLSTRYKANIQPIQCDISIEKETKNLFKTLNDLPIPLGGIIHAAGVLQDGILVEQSWNNFQKVFASKMNGTWNLHQYSHQIDLDFFICFSSMTSVLGASGQTNYGAANAYLDVFAKYRRGLGLPCQSINWGPWTEGGMASNMSKKDQQRIKDMGISYFFDNEALDIFTILLSSTTKAQLGTWKINWTDYFKNQNANKSLAFLENFKSLIEKPEDTDSSLLKELEEKPVQERADFFLRYMQKEIATLMGMDSPDDIEPKQPLFDLGVDSLVTIDLNNRLQKSIHKELDASLIFDYPTLEALTNYILNEILELGESKEYPIVPTSDLIADTISESTEEQLADELSKLLE